jgi:hypothetical protein
VIATDLRPGDRFRPDSGRDEPLHTAHSVPRRDGVNAGLVHLRLSVEGVDDGAPFDATFIATAVLLPA